jgi:hypothetical protein
MSYSYSMSDPRPRDDRDVAKDTARDLAEIASRIGHLIGDANAYLTDPNYNTLRLRLELADAAVEGAMVEARGRGPSLPTTLRPSRSRSSSAGGLRTRLNPRSGP